MRQKAPLCAEHLDSTSPRPTATYIDTAARQRRRPRADINPLRPWSGSLVHVARGGFELDFVMGAGMVHSSCGPGESATMHFMPFHRLHA